MRLNDIIKEYASYLNLAVKGITMQRYLQDVRLFMLHMRNADSADVKDSDVIEYLNMLEALEWEHNAVVRKQQAIKGLWRWMNRKGHECFSAELIPDMKQVFKFPYVTPEADYEKVLKSLSTLKKRNSATLRNRALIMLAWDTGARSGELCSLDVGDLDLKAMKCRVKTEKSRGMRPFRELYWTKATHRALLDWLKYRRHLIGIRPCLDGDALFFGIGNILRGKRLTSHAVAITFRECANRAGIPRFNAHGMRHHMGHELSKRGANNSQISSILGHSQLSSSYVYTELNNREREETYDKFMRRK